LFVLLPPKPRPTKGLISKPQAEPAPTGSATKPVEEHKIYLFPTSLSGLAYSISYEK